MVNIYPVRSILYFSLLLTRIACFSELFIFRVFEALLKELERNMCLPIFFAYVQGCIIEAFGHTKTAAFSCQIALLNVDRSRISNSNDLTEPAKNRVRESKYDYLTRNDVIISSSSGNQ